MSPSPPRKPTNAPANPPVALQFDFHLTDPHVQQAIRDRAARLAENVGETTGRAVTDALEVALREGMSIADTAKLIDKVAFGLSAAQRATTIARTETIGALNHGQFMAAAESGVIEGKEWLTQGDSRVRETHTACEHEGVIPMDGTFSNGCSYPGDPAGEPEEVINCVADADAEIVTSTGRKRISEVAVGDYVLSHKLRYRRVVRVRSRDPYSGPLVSLWAGGRQVCVTGGHPFLTRSGWNRALALQVGNEIAVLCPAAHVEGAEFLRDEVLRGRVPLPLESRSHPALGHCRVERHQLGAPEFGPQVRQQQPCRESARASHRLKAMHGHPVGTRLLESALIADAVAEGGLHPLAQSEITIGEDRTQKPLGLAVHALPADAETAIGIEEASDVGEVGGENHSRMVLTYARIEKMLITAVTARRVFNLAVDEDESYIINGIVSHNCRCSLLYYNSLEGA